jgi:hypothetical protein
VLFLGVWVPLLVVELPEEDLPQLEAQVGAAEIRPLVAIDLELARGVDVCLDHAERLLAAAPNGLVGRGGPKRAQDWTGYPQTDESGAIVPGPGASLSTQQCHVVALNLSKEDDAAAELDPVSPVPAATEAAARQLLVFIAAGNLGERDDLSDTRSPWARAPWVLAVGATDDEEGTKIAAYSGRGPAGEGPELVAWGASALDHAKVGTSFAAPRALREALVLAAWLHTLRHAAAMLRGQPPSGIPLVGAAMIDVGPPGWPTAQLAIPAYPLVGVDLDALAGALDALGPAAAALQLIPTPGRLRAALLRSARPVDAPGAPGFVSRATTTDYLSAFDGRELAALALDHAPDGDLPTRPLISADQLAPAIDVWDQGALHVYYDHETQEVTLN